MITPFVDFSGKGDTKTKNLTSIQEEANNYDRDYSILAPLTIVKFGTQDVFLTSAKSTDPDGFIYSIPHGLGYSPIFQIYFKIAGTAIDPLPYLSSSGAFPDITNSLPFDTQQSCWADNTNINFTWHGGAQAPAQKFFYVIYSNPIV